TATAPPKIYPLSLHDALPISWAGTLLAAVLAITALVTGVIVTRRAVRTITRYVRALTHGRSAEDILTVVAATIATGVSAQGMWRSEEHTSELQSRENLVCRLL